MAFQLKDFVSIAAGMINHMRGTQRSITDFNIGSVVRTLVEAVAVEIDQVYQQMFSGLREAIPVATYNSFSFERQLAAPASGVIRVTVTVSDVDLQIPAGAVFTTPLSRTGYVLSSAASVEAGDSYVDVFVSAQKAGIIGNVAAASVFTMTPNPAGFVGASNATAFSNGQDLETDDQRKQRFALFISTLPRGTVDAIKYGARTVVRKDASGAELERVRAVSVVEPYLEDDLNPISLVNVFVHNGVGSTTADLVAETVKVLHGYTDESTGKRIPGWKAAGVKVVVAAADEEPLNVTGVLTVAPGYNDADLIAACVLAINTYIAGLNIGESFVHADIIFILKSIDGVVDFVFSTPTGNVTCGADAKIISGTITVT